LAAALMPRANTASWHHSLPQPTASTPRGLPAPFHKVA
jgi:hypothetical protein